MGSDQLLHVLSIMLNRQNKTVLKGEDIMAESKKDIGGHIVLAAIIFGCCVIFAAHLASSRIQVAIHDAVEKMSAEVGRAATGLETIASNSGQYTALMDQRRDSGN
jgi:hypothetical protein